ncbi:MAG: hypothetical protein ACODAJ_14080, partial [Planctomycetota bacterium]
MTTSWTAAACLLSTCLVARALAFDGYRVTLGPVTLDVAELPEITAYGTPADVAVTVSSEAEGPLEVELEMRDLVDSWHAVGDASKTVTVAAGGEQTVTFQIAAGKGAFSAHYPVHVYGRFQWEGAERTLHAVRVFVPQFRRTEVSSAEPTPMEPLVVPAKGAVSLFATDLQRVAWRYFDQPLVYKRQGWQGSDPKSRASFVRRAGVVRGASRDAITMHPPWVPGGGTIFADYQVKLPESTPLTLTFANAIRDHTEAEPPSDGVTFRVWAADTKLFERHTDSKTWVEGEADLSDYAGQQILLRLESHPGPKRNTACDSSYWGEPVIIAGEPPTRLTEAEREALRQRARAAVQRGRAEGADEFVFRLGGGDDACAAAVVLGPTGIVDGAIALGRGERCVTFDGLRVSVLGHPVGRGPSQIQLEDVGRIEDSPGVQYALRMGDAEHRLCFFLGSQDGGFQIGAGCTGRITDIALGPADQTAPRVCYGHGYVIEQPEAFRAGFGGHNLATSHVGFDFESGVSV